MFHKNASFELPLTALQYVTLGIVVSLALSAWRHRTASKYGLPLPPGPAGLPVVGNAPTIIRESIKGLQHLLMFRWAREYGEIFRVRIGPFEEYFINSDAAVKVRDYSSAS